MRKKTFAIFFVAVIFGALHGCRENEAENAASEFCACASMHDSNDINNIRRCDTLIMKEYYWYLYFNGGTPLEGIWNQAKHDSLTNIVLDFRRRVNQKCRIEM